MMFSFSDSIHKYGLKNNAASKVNFNKYFLFSFLNKIGIYLRDGCSRNDTGIVNLYPPKGTHWLIYKNENYFDSYGCSPPQKLSKFIIKRSRHCLYCEYKVQVLTNRRNSY